MLKVVKERHGSKEGIGSFEITQEKSLLLRRQTKTESRWRSERYGPTLTTRFSRVATTWEDSSSEETSTTWRTSTG